MPSASRGASRIDLIGFGELPFVMELLGALLAHVQMRGDNG
jgi:hypothetical protein